MKNKTKKALCAISILGVVAISGIFAYLTDNESKENVFTIGNVDIELLEPSWEIDGETVLDANGNEIPDFAENVLPGQVIDKDPQIKNVGSNDAYVFMKVTVPKDWAITADEDGELENNGENVQTELFTYEIDRDNWRQISGYYENDDGSVTRYYAYKAVLPADDTDDANVTTPLFESVQLANVINTAFTKTTDTNIKIEAYAIQCDAIPNADDIDPTDEYDMCDVFNLISSQNDLGVTLEAR